MNNPMALSKTSDLYPPTDPDSGRLLDIILTGEHDDERRAIIRRAITSGERDQLRARARALDPWMKLADGDQIETVILQTGLGLATKAETAREAALRVRHYAEILADVPLWAIKRACHRFATGSVTADELRDRNFAAGMVPTTAHLHRVASGMSRPLAHERIRITAALNGIVRRGPPTEEEKQRVRDLHAQFVGRAEPEAEQLEKARLQVVRQEMEKRHAAGAEALRVQEFTDAGVDAPKTPPGGIAVTLTTMLKLGYTIEEHPEGGNVLVAPARIAAPKAAPHFSDKTRETFRRPKAPKLDEQEGDSL